MVALKAGRDCNQRKSTLDDRGMMQLIESQLIFPHISSRLKTMATVRRRCFVAIFVFGLRCVACTPTTVTSYLELTRFSNGTMRH